MTALNFRNKNIFTCAGIYKNVWLFTEFKDIK